MLKKGTPASPEHRPREQRLSGTRRPDEQHALGHSSAQALNPRRILEEVDHLLQFLLGFFGAGHIFERDLVVGLGVDADCDWRPD